MKKREATSHPGATAALDQPRIHPQNRLRDGRDRPSSRGFDPEQGQPALSTAWLAMLTRAFPETAIRLIERRPRHPRPVFAGKLAQERDPVLAFERLWRSWPRCRRDPSWSGRCAATPRSCSMRPHTAAAVRRVAPAAEPARIIASTGYYADDIGVVCRACRARSSSS